MAKKFLLAALIFYAFTSFILSLDSSNEMRDKDRSLAYILSGNINIVFTTIETLNDELVLDSAYLDKSQEEVCRLIDVSGQYIYDANRSIVELETLNDNFVLDLDRLVFCLRDMEEKLDDGGQLSEKNIAFMKALLEIRRVYSNARIPSYYEYDTTRFKKMALPEKTEKLFSEIDALAQDYLQE